MARQLTDEELQAASTTLSPAGLLTRPVAGAPELDAIVQQQIADGSRYAPAVLDAALGSGGIVTAQNSVADEANAAFDARQQDAALAKEDDRLRNLTPRERLQEREVRIGQEQRFQRDQFGYGQHQDAIRNNLAAQELQLRDASIYSELAARKISSETAIQEKIDTGNFLTGAHSVALDDPQYDEKIAGHLAANPHVPPSVVNSYLSSVSPKRESYIKAAQLGGSAAFEAGPARDAYNESFAQDHDPAKAAVNANNVAKGVAMINQAFKDNLITEDNITPGHKDSFLDKDGKTDYGRATRIIAEATGKVAGLTDKQESKEVDDNRALAVAYADPLKRRDPQVQALWQGAVNFLAEHQKRTAAGAKGAPAVTTGAVPAGNDDLTKF